MSNPNRQNFSVEPDDEKNTSDLAPLGLEPQIAPDNLRFLFNKQRSEEAAFRQYEDDAGDIETVSPGKRRKKVARSLKGLFRARNLAVKAEKKASKVPLSPLENVIPIDSRKRPVKEPLTEERSADTVPEAVGQEAGADIQEIFRVDPDAADSPDHQAAEDLLRGTFDSSEDVPQSESPVAPGGSGAGGGGYDGPPPPPTPPSPAGSSSRPRVEDYLPPAAVHNPVRILPASVERQGGIAGPLTAFFAANYLSRRRNRRARKETNKLKTEIKDTQRQQQAESRRLRSIEDSIRNNSPAPVVSPPSIESKKTIIAAAPPVTESGPTKVSEILAATAAVNKNSFTQKQPEQKQSTPVAVSEATPRAPSIPRAPKDAQKEVVAKTLSEELSQLNDMQIKQRRAIEALQERRQKPEPVEYPQQAKRDNVAEAQKPATQESLGAKPTSQPRPRGVPPVSMSPSPSLPSVTAQRASASTRSSGNNATVRTSHQPMVTDDRQKELYKKSMRAGVVTGLIVAGLGVLVYIILL